MKFEEYKKLPKWNGKIFTKDEATCFNDGFEAGANIYLGMLADETKRRIPDRKGCTVWEKSLTENSLKQKKLYDYFCRKDSMSQNGRTYKAGQKLS